MVHKVKDWEQKEPNAALLSSWHRPQSKRANSGHYQDYHTCVSHRSWAKDWAHKKWEVDTQRKKKNVFQKHIEQFGLERTLKIIQFQSSAMSRNLSLHQGAQSPIQTSLEHYQGCSTQFLWAIYSSVSEFPPSIYLTHAPFSWEPYPFVLSLHASVKCPSPFQACTLAPAWIVWFCCSPETVNVSHVNRWWWLGGDHRGQAKAK